MCSGIPTKIANYDYNGATRIERYCDSCAKETSLLDSFATAQMEQEIQNKVLDATRKLSDTLIKETGIQATLQEEDIKEYCRKVLAEIERK